MNNRIIWTGLSVTPVFQGYVAYSQHGMRFIKFMFTTTVPGAEDLHVGMEVDKTVTSIEALFPTEIIYNQRKQTIQEQLQTFIGDITNKITHVEDVAGFDEDISKELSWWVQKEGEEFDDSEQAPEEADDESDDDEPVAEPTSAPSKKPARQATKKPTAKD